MDIVCFFSENIFFKQKGAFLLRCELYNGTQKMMMLMSERKKTSAIIDPVLYYDAIRGYFNNVICINICFAIF